MASAGRILIMPKGNYNAETKYEKLDLVFHSGASWLAKKDAVGIEPSDANAEYWFMMCGNTDVTELEQRIAEIENQLLSVANLDEIDLSAYATKAEVKEVSEDVALLEETVGGLSEDVGGLKEIANGLPTTFSKVQFLTYVGNGGVGSEYACSVTADFPIRVLLYVGCEINNGEQICETGAGNIFSESTIMCDSLTTTYKQGYGFRVSDVNKSVTRYAKKSEDGRTIYWCLGGDGSTYTSQLNLKNAVYFFIAIG